MTMSISTKYARVTEQTFDYQEVDIARILRENAAASQHWSRVPAGCVERVEVEFEDRDDPCGRSRVHATVTRTFTKQEAPVKDQAR